MTRVPTPRFDLLKMQHYLFGSVQFSRGCPFQCEFCDIIVTFGRRPRLKTSAQVLAELEALRAQHIDIVFIVDDNLIGNKKAIKVLLRDLIAYQKAHGYPFDFFTEASLDLAEDDELLELMVEANISSVFIGIESPLDEVAQALAVPLPLAEAVDDDEVGAPSHCFGDTLAGVLQPRDVEPAAAGSGIEILRQQQFLAAVKQYSRQAGVGALACLHHADDAEAPSVQIGGKAAQDRVRILVRAVDKGGKVALGIEPDPLRFR